MNKRVLKAPDLDRCTPYLMLFPAIIAICIVHIYPSISSIKMSFFDVNLLNPKKSFVGFGNYVAVFKDPIVFRILLNTLLWTVASLSLGSIVSLCIAIQLNKPFKGRGFFRTLYLAPWVTPPIVIATIWKLVLSRDFSPISGLLMNLGIIEKPIEFLSNPTIYFGFLSIPMIYLILVNLWNFLPFCIVMFLAGLQSIPSELYEAATVDGASKFQQFKNITIPMLLPVVETVILLQGIWQFNNFNLSYLVTHGGPLNTTELMAVRVYNEAFVNFKYSYGAALSVVMVAMVIVPSIMYIRRVINEEKTETL